MSIMRNYMPVAVRNLLRQKTYSIINISGLAIGLGACMILSMWIHYHLSFDQFHDKADRICRPILDVNLEGINPNQHCGSTGIMGPLVVDEFPEVENYVRLWRPRQSARVRNGETVQTYWEFFYADPSFFDIFSFEFKYGSPGTALREPNSMVLSEEAATALFGNQNPVGQTVDVGGQTHYKITGVLRRLPQNSHLQFQILASFDKTWLTEHIRANQYEPDFLTYLLLRPDTDLRKLEAKMPALIQKVFPEVASGVNIYFQPLKRIHLYSSNITFNHLSWRSLDIAYIYIFSAIAVLILFIASVNYINLATARVSRRAKEVGIRKTAGATKTQLVMQFLGESILLTFCAMILGYILVEIGMPLLNGIFDNELSFDRISRLQLIGTMALFSLLVGLLTGWYPALVLSRPTPQEALKSSASGGARGFSLRRLLVVIQFCITMILIVVSFTIGKQLQWVQNKNLGFNKDQIVSFKMPASIQANYETVRHELLQKPWIAGVSALGPIDFPGFQGKRFEFEGQTEDGFWVTSCTAVDYNFLDFYGLTLVEGRNFSKSMETDEKNAYIINETLKRKMGWKTAVGKRFWLKEHKAGPGRVIGVVKDFNWRSLHQNIDGFVMFLRPEVLKHMAVSARPEKIRDLIGDMRSVWAQYAPNSAFEYSFLDEVYARLYSSEEKTRGIVNVFSFLAIFVASIGLLGLISYSTEQRTKEIGVRKVLGASAGNVLILLSREFFILLSLAVLLAWPAAWVLSERWLSNFAYRAQMDVSIYLLSWGITLVVALLTISGQVIRAARANPVESLRYE